MLNEVCACFKEAVGVLLITRAGKPEWHLLELGLCDGSLQRPRLEHCCTTFLETEAHVIIPVLQDRGQRKTPLFRRSVPNLGLRLIWGSQPGAVDQVPPEDSVPFRMNVFKEQKQ